MTDLPSLPLDRRSLIRGGAALALAQALPGWAATGTQDAAQGALSGETIALSIGDGHFATGGRSAHAISVNGSTPAPLIRLREGQHVNIAVTNRLKEDSSIHWHGLILPFQMDGVPGISFPGIMPGETFTYRFPVRQAGTYWYHSHSGMQEAMGLYGPIIIDPAGPDPVAYDREHVILLTDWSPVHPHKLLQRLKQMGGYYNMQRQTLAGLLAGKDQALKDRIDWGAMRMDPTDISDVTGATYSYLVNGMGTAENWTGLFAPGERVRLRIINASAMTNFNIRLPGLPMTVIQCDGQDVQPVETDEFQIGIAETYDVIVQPGEAKPYALIAEAIDRSGLVRATLAPQAGMVAPVPARRARPLLGMKDMGMDMGGGMAPRGVDPSAEQNASRTLASPGSPAAAPIALMDHATMKHGAMDHSAMPGMDHSGGAMAGHDMGSMSMRDFGNAPQVKRGPGVQTISPMPVDRTGEPGQGLTDVGHKVLVYRDLMALERNPDVRAPSRSIDIHLTGNMERFMWSLDGEKMSDVHEPIPFIEGERVRVNLINDSMMAHPIHIHGHFFELVTGHGDRAPRKHTVIVQPGGIVTWDFTADAVGDWAFHCHLLYHMAAGMMRVVSVRPKGDAA